MISKYTSCRWFECINRSFELPALASCIGQYYEPYPYCGIRNPFAPADVREVKGECAPPQDESDWSWYEFDPDHNRTEENLISRLDRIFPLIDYPCQ